MSVLKKDQVFPIKTTAISDAELATIVADALRHDFGDTPSAIKQIGRLTNANLRAIKNWYGARNTPSSGHLLLLARSSPSILEFILKQVGGDDLLDAFHLLGNKSKEEMMSLKSANEHKIYSIKSDTINLSLPPRIAQRLNARQLWFLTQLQNNAGGKAEDISTQWGVSVASAKRDIAEVTRLKLIRFEGARKTGRYILIKEKII